MWSSAARKGGDLGRARPPCSTQQARRLLPSRMRDRCSAGRVGRECLVPDRLAREALEFSQIADRGDPLIHGINAVRPCAVEVFPDHDPALGQRPLPLLGARDIHVVPVRVGIGAHHGHARAPGKEIVVAFESEDHRCRVRVLREECP